jgi:hypothetical protein
MENMPQMADFVYKFYNQKLIAYQEKKRVRIFFISNKKNNNSIFL